MTRNYINSRQNFTIDRFDLVPFSIASTITKIIDLGLGLISLPFVLLTLGMSDKLNNFCLRQVRELNVISMPVALAFGLISPKSDSIKNYFLPV